jgi:hypothetical protein
MYWRWRMKLKDNSKKDCFAYNGKECKALNDLYCKYQKCSFYKTEEDYEEDERIAEERLSRIGRR